MRPFTEEDELLDVRGQRMFPPGTTVTARQSAFRPVSMFSSVPHWNGDTQQLTSNGGNEEQPPQAEASDTAATEKNAMKKKRKKKTRSESDTYVTPSLTRALNGLDLSSEGKYRFFPEQFSTSVFFQLTIRYSLKFIFILVTKC